jgi:hypothetical protein
LTVIRVFASPALTSSEMNALTGMGEGDGDGDGAGEGDGDGVGVGLASVEGVGVGVPVAATRRNHRGSVASTRMPLIGARKVTTYLHGRPGYRPGRRRFRETPRRVEHPAQPALQHADLGRAQQFLHCFSERTLVNSDEGSLHVAAQL